MNVNENVSDILSHTIIERKACDKWNSKTIQERIHASYKYKHIFVKYNLPSNDWANKFDGLTSYQRNILLKGELIRTYDSLPNIDKTKIKREFGLSHFSSKWFKLSPHDKKKLLNSVLYNAQESKKCK